MAFAKFLKLIDLLWQNDPARRLTAEAACASPIEIYRLLCACEGSSHLEMCLI
jgi:hypothetical protein